MASILITGANGFIGSRLVTRHLEAGDQVVGVVRTTSNLARLGALPPGPGTFRLLIADLRRLDESGRDPLGDALANADLVYHCAAVLMGTSRAAFFDANTEGTRRMLAATLARKRETFHRFLYISSLAAAGPSDSERPIDETAPMRPVSWYGESKMAAERIVADYGSRGLPCTIVRPCAVYGETEKELNGSVLPAARLGLIPRVGFAPGSATFVHVDDLVDGIRVAAAAQAARGKTYFLTDGAVHPATAAGKAAATAFGRKRRLELPVPPLLLAPAAIVAELVALFTRGRPGLTRDKLREIRQRHWSCSSAAAQRDLDWHPRIDLASGITRTVQWWQAERERRRTLDGTPLREVALQCYLLALLVGFVVEGSSAAAGLYVFDPPWLVWVVIFVIIGGVMGTVTLLTVRASFLVAFLAGAAVGITAEMLNEFVLHRWTFTERITSLLPNGTVRAIVMGLAAGLMAPVIHAVVRALWSRRQRVG